MRHLKSSLLTAGMVLLGMGMALPAAADSFNTTNLLYFAATANTQGAITGWPTNTPASNGIGNGTGGAVDISNYHEVGFWFTGDVIDITNGTITAGTVTVTLLRSPSPRPPQVIYGTNVYVGGTNLQTCEWETTSNLVGGITLAIPINTTNRINWFTNLPSWQIGSANWLGVFNITNSGVTYFITNMNMGVSKKILPVRYP